MKVIAVITAGGMGTRLWPVSRETHPKHLLKLTDGQTLLETTYRRALMIPGVGEILIVTNRETYSLLEPKLLRSHAASSLSFILEPVSRNTCAAICAASLAVHSQYGDDVCIIAMPADHVVNGRDEFVSAVERAVKAAAMNRLVMFGVPATCSETGYGYIECAERANDEGEQAMSVSRFIEKPKVDAAQRFVASGRHLWNTGILCFRPAVVLQELEDFAPQVMQAVRQATTAARDLSTGYTRISELERASFARSDDISIDHAILERSSRLSVVFCGFDWSDIGCWKAVSALAKPDLAGNRVDGDARLLDTAGCYIRSERRLVGAIGLKDMIVIDSDDALLIVPKARAQAVKQLVTELKGDGHDCVRMHRTVRRPWGCYTVLVDDDGFKVKRLVVEPGASLSLQLHRHRAEHWIVVKGIAEATIGNSVATLQPRASLFIPIGTRHRIANTGTDDLIVIEVQFGELLSEDDIVRFDDIYGRGELNDA